MQENINQSETGLEDFNLFLFRRKTVAMNQVINRVGVVLKGLFCLFFTFVSLGGVYAWGWIFLLRFFFSICSYCSDFCQWKSVTSNCCVTV